MKRIFPIILLLALVLSACGTTNESSATVPSSTESTAPTESTGSTEPTNPEDPTESTGTTEPTETQPNEPTQEELAAMWEYAQIAISLDRYLSDGYLFFSIYDADGNVVETLRDQEALQHCYQRLVAMECIDRWVGTEYTEGIHWRDEIPNWDRQSYVDGFLVLQDLKLRQDYILTGSDGTTESGTESAWFYDANGVLTSVDGIEHMFEQVQSLPVFLGNFQVYLSYHENGTLSQILYGSNAYGTATPIYDESGVMTGMTVESRDYNCTVTYAYDGGRVVKISWMEYDCPYDIEYTYDAGGNVVRSVYTARVATDNLGNNMHNHHRLIFDYTYSGDQLVSATCLEENWSWEWDENGDYVFFVEVTSVDNYIFGYDQQGRLSTIDITYGDDVYAHGDKAGTILREPEFVSKQIMLIYGNYYFYYG